MKPQKFTANRVIRVLLDGGDKSQMAIREHIAVTGPVHTWTRGSVRVSMSRVTIVCEAGFSHELITVGNGNTMNDGQPLVRLAAIQQARLVVGLPMLTVAEEDSFLKTCKPVEKRPLSPLMTARQEARRQAKTRPGLAREVAA